MLYSKIEKTCAAIAFLAYYEESSNCVNGMITINTLFETKLVNGCLQKRGAFNLSNKQCSITLHITGFYQEVRGAPVY